MQDRFHFKEVINLTIYETKIASLKFSNTLHNYSMATANELQIVLKHNVLHRWFKHYG